MLFLLLLLLLILLLLLRPFKGICCVSSSVSSEHIPSLDKYMLLLLLRLLHLLLPLLLRPLLPICRRCHSPPCFRH